MQRYDTVTLQAVQTDEGFYNDSPVIGRTGILIYRNADGTERREYRPPEEAFNDDSLKSIRGKPVTLGHHGMVTADNIGNAKAVGTVLSAARKDGNTIRADVVIYNLDTTDRELSCGYTTTLDETAGVTPEGEHYDAVQRNIRYNHLAIVTRGRAGVARLNLDGEQYIEESEDAMEKIKLDSGLEYEAAPEVKLAFDSMKEKAEADKKAFDELQAKYDVASAEVEKLKADAVKAEEAYKADFAEAVKTALELREIAKEKGVENADGMSNDEIKRAVIAKVYPDVKLDGKSADYIEAIFDMSKAAKAEKADAMAGQREKLNSKPTETKEDTIEDLKAKLLEAERNLFLGGNE